MAAFPRRLTVAVVGVGVGLVFAAGLAEAVVRGLNPRPRAQVIDSARMTEARWEQGYPLWRELGSDARDQPECAPGATEVLMVGSSITFGIGLDAADAVSARLQRRLSADGSAWCVRNVGEPAYSGEQKRIVAEAGIARWHPRVLIYEVWTNDGGDYLRVGDLAVNTGGMRHDAEGWPAPPIPVPAWLHHAAMVHSAAWRYASIALAGEGDVADPAAWSERVPARLGRVSTTLGDQGQMLVWLAARLDSPFAGQAASNPTSSDYGNVMKWGEANDVTVIDPAAAWTAEDPSGMGVDRICHLNAEGSDKLAALLEPRVRELAARQAP